MTYNVSSVLKAWINCLGSDPNIHSPEVRPGIHTYCYGIPLLSSHFSMIHLTLSNPCSLPSQSYRQKRNLGWGEQVCPILGSHALVRDKLREGHLLCWLNLHHRVTVTTVTTVLPGGCGQKKKGWHKSITGCLLLLVTHMGYPFPLPGPEIEASQWDLFLSTPSEHFWVSGCFKSRMGIIRQAKLLILT